MWKGSRPFWIVSFNCLDKDFKRDLGTTREHLKESLRSDDITSMYTVQCYGQCTLLVQKTERLESALP